MTTKKRLSGDWAHVSVDPQISTLENLVDELVKDSPSEDQVRHWMQASGIEYSADPMERMNLVLTALDEIRGRSRRRTTEKDT